MPTTETSELYFIAGAFVLILVICAVSVFVFFRQLKREKNRPPRSPENPVTSNTADEEE